MLHPPRRTNFVAPNLVAADKSSKTTTRLAVTVFSRYNISTKKSIEIKLSWSVLILKILAVQPDGRATNKKIIRDLAVLSLNGPTRQSDVGCIFSNKLVSFPERGVWQLTERGRAVVDYLTRQE